MKKKEFRMEQNPRGHSSRWLADFFGWQNVKRFIYRLRLRC